MDNILKKALGEVLTPRYSEELRDAFDTGYSFSEEFESRMEILIRKTDRPAIYRYRGYLAAAAAVVIAAGSAVLIPAVINNKVSVSDPLVTVTASAVTQNVITAEDDVSENTTVTENTTVSESTATDTDTADTDANDDTAAVIIDSASGTETVTQTSPEPAQTEPSVTSSENTSSDTTQTADDATIIVDDDSEKEDDSDEDEPIVDDSDSDVVEDAPAGDTIVLNVPAGKTMGEVFDENFGVSFNDLWANYAEYCPTGSHSTGSYSSFTPDNDEYTFIQDFVHKLGSAESLEYGFGAEPGEAVINLHIEAKPPKQWNYKEHYSNGSSWRYYDVFFNAGDDSDETDDSDPIEEGDAIIPADSDDIEITDNAQRIYPRFRIQVYKNSCGVSFNSYIEFFNEKTNATDLYSIGVYKMNREDVDALFEGFEKMYIVGTPATVSDISDSLGITADNIVQSWSIIDRIFDTNVRYADIAPEFIGQFFRKHGSDKITLNGSESWVGSEDGERSTYYSEEFEINGEVRFTAILKGGTVVNVTLSSDGKCFIDDRFRSWYFNITLEDIKDVMRAVAEKNGFEIRFYSTLGEYLAGKNFDKLSYAECVIDKDDGKSYLVTVNDEKDLRKLYDMIAAEADSAEYLPGFWNGLGNAAAVKADKHLNSILLKSDDVLYIRTFSNNHFRLSKGFTERFRKAIEECASAEWQEIDVDPDTDDDDEQIVDD